MKLNNIILDLTRVLLSILGYYLLFKIGWQAAVGVFVLHVQMLIIIGQRFEAIEEAL